MPVPFRDRFVRSPAGWLLLLILHAGLSGCSVYQAADKRGADPLDVLRCETLTCLQAFDSAETIERQSLANGETRHFIRMLRRQGSTGRAVFHAGANLISYGLWEFVAAPAEGALQEEDFFVVHAVCVDNACRDVRLYELD